MKSIYYSLFILLLSFTSCKTSPELIRKKGSEQIVIGFSEGIYVLGKTEKSDVNLDKLEDEKGLILHWDITKTLYLVEIRDSTYETRKGCSLGDTKEMILENYGPPDETVYNLYKSKKKETIVASAKGLFYYKIGLLFFTDKEENVGGITIGQEPKINKNP